MTGARIVRAPRGPADIEQIASGLRAGAFDPEAA